jgi:hypothetical protein
MSLVSGFATLFRSEHFTHIAEASEMTIRTRQQHRQPANADLDMVALEQ